MKKESSMKYFVLSGVVALVVAAAIGGVFLLKPDLFSFGKKIEETKPPASAATPAKASQYQAVFLSNGQIYFGKIANLTSRYPSLTDVYYLRVTQSLQPGQAGSADNVKVTGKTDQAAPQTQNELTLIKLGNEIHGPADQIQINRDHIIFVENLKEDSKVVKAISEYQAKNK